MPIERDNAPYDDPFNRETRVWEREPSSNNTGAPICAPSNPEMDERSSRLFHQGDSAVAAAATPAAPTSEFGAPRPDPFGQQVRPHSDAEPSRPGPRMFGHELRAAIDGPSNPQPDQEVGGKWSGYESQTLDEHEPVAARSVRKRNLNKDLLAQARAATDESDTAESVESAEPAKTNRRRRGFGPVMGRRKFLGMAGLATAGITLSTLPKVFGEQAAAQTGARSLVCIFLSGGADSFNMFVPRDVREDGHSHSIYSATRGSFAIPAGSLLPIGDGNFGLNPGLPGMAKIAGDSQLAVVTNVGPLVRPTTKSDFLAGRSVPQSLFAHDAQQKLWQTGRPTLVADQGWGGAVTAAVSDGALAPSFSTNGSNVWLSGLGSKYSRISPSISVALLQGYDPGTRDWIPRFSSINDALMTNLEVAKGSQSLFDQAATSALEESILTTEALLAATADDEGNEVGMDDVVGTDLGGQLRLVAKLIKNRDQLDMPRQIFFVRIDGWDTHGEQAVRFPELLTELDDAVSSFHASMKALDMSDSVTTFTASDFGRTLTINGDGTDHGWGGHSFIMGGAVNPGQYGTLPNLTASASNPDDIGDRNSDFAGRLIPTTSVAQHGATLAKWMGLGDSQLDRAFPELANFSTRDLGFMKA